MNYDKLIQYYEYFYSRVYSYRDYVFVPSDREEKIIRKFAQTLDQNISLGDNYLFEYFAFQFNYWSSKKYKRISSVVPSYIFGEKAILRYNERNKEASYFNGEFIRKYQLSINHLTGDKYYERDLFNLSTSEEKEKERINDSSERLINCIIHTTLYNIRSQVCVFCTQSKECKVIQLKKYPEIYKLRNEKSIC